MILRDEVTGLLQELIRVNTVNPPGRETAAAEMLQRYFAAAGVEAALVSRDADRASVTARIPGRGDGPSLLLLSHTDTVRAEPEEWSRDPWSGDLAGGEVWGRGALDMKGHVAASAVAFASLAREGFLPAGDLVFLSTADEEVGVSDVDEAVSLQWLVDAHPEHARTDFALNEGGGERVVLDGRVYYICAVAEKMSAPFRLRVRGRTGHASVPSIADNALVKAARLVDALGRYGPPPQMIPEMEQFLEVVLGDVPPAGEVAERCRGLHPLAVELVEPLLQLTLSPTMIEASKQRNVIPGVCEVTVDCRLLPGQTPRDVDPVIRSVLGDGDWELEWLEAWGGTRSPTDTPLWRALERFVDEIEPGARLVPICSPGFTDSHWLRDSFGTTAYGFFPLKAMDFQTVSRLVHSADERIAVDDLELGVHAFRSAALALGA